MSYCAVLVLLFSSTCHGSLYRRLLIPGDTWPNYMYSQHVVNASSLVECAAFCQSDNTNCNVFAKEGSDCFRGGVNRSETLVPRQTKHGPVYVRVDGVLDFFRTDVVDVKNVTDVLWERYIYGYTDLDPASIGDQLDCFFLCQYVETGCAIFAKEDLRCYFGNTTTQTGVATGSVKTTRTVYFTKECITSFDTSGITVKADIGMVVGAEWSKYIFQSTTEDDDAGCSGHCTLLESKQCHFYAFDPEENTCYLGNFMLIDSVIPVSSKSLNITVQYDEANGDFINTYARYCEYSEQWHPYVYKAILLQSHVSGNLACRMACFLDDKCESAARGGSFCYLASFATATPMTTGGPPPGWTLIFCPKQGVAFQSTTTLPDSHFFQVSVNSYSWPKMLIKSINGISSVKECAALCLTKSYTFIPYTELKYCGFFTVKDNNCYVGNTTANTGHYFATSSETVALYIHKGRIDWTASQLYSPISKAGSAWSANVYKTVTLTGTSGEALTECTTFCLLDGRPCMSYVVDYPKCHLGDPLVDAAIVSSSTAMTVYERQATALIQHGGIITAGYTSSWTVYTESQTLCYAHTMGTNAVSVRGYHGMAYVDHLHLLLICGGRSAGANSQKRDCVGKFMTERGRRAWKNLENMPRKRLRFNLIHMPGTSYVYAIGGKDSYECHNAIDRYNADTDTWTTNYDDFLNVRQQDTCAVVVEDKIWLIGGYRCVNQEDTDTVHVYTPATKQWATKTSLPDPTTLVACGKYTASNNGHELVVVAGGVSSGKWNEQLIFFDLTSNSGWNYLNDLPRILEGYPTSQSLAVMSKLEMYLMAGKTDVDGYGYKNNWLLYQADDRTFYTKDLPSEYERTFYSSHVVPLQDLWSCIPQSDEWILMMRQFTAGGLFTTANILSYNTANVHASRYSDIANLDTYKSCDGKYHFRLVWPELGYFNEWKQTNSPTGAPPGSGYEAIAISFSTRFGGLWTHSNRLEGDTHSTAHWYTAGTTAWYTGSTIPGPITDLVQGVTVTQVELYILKDC